MSYHLLVSAALPTAFNRYWNHPTDHHECPWRFRTEDVVVGQCRIRAPIQRLEGCFLCSFQPDSTLLLSRWAIISSLATGLKVVIASRIGIVPQNAVGARAPEASRRVAIFILDFVAFLSYVDLFVRSYFWSIVAIG